MLRLIAPHLRLQSVRQLSLDRLRDLGLDALLLDVDCTLKRYRDEEVTPEVAAWLDELPREGSACAWSPTAWEGACGGSPRGSICRLSPRR